jgi:hypothetical protein
MPPASSLQQLHHPCNSRCAHSAAALHAGVGGLCMYFLLECYSYFTFSVQVWSPQQSLGSGLWTRQNACILVSQQRCSYGSRRNRIARHACHLLLLSALFYHAAGCACPVLGIIYMLHVYGYFPLAQDLCRGYGMQHSQALGYVRSPVSTGCIMQLRQHRSDVRRGTGQKGATSAPCWQQGDLGPERTCCCSPSHRVDCMHR